MRHSTLIINKNINNKMTESIFKTCSDVMNKQSLANLGNGTYYCPLVEHILPDGIVHYDTDIIGCTHKEHYESSPILIVANDIYSKYSKSTYYD